MRKTGQLAADLKIFSLQKRHKTEKPVDTHRHVGRQTDGQKHGQTERQIDSQIEQNQVNPQIDKSYLSGHLFERERYVERSEMIFFLD